MPGLFEDSELDSYGYAQTNPAAPKGMGQAAQAAERKRAGVPGYENSQLGGNLDAYGFTDTARSWYTGANNQGIENGWDNSFVEKFISGQEKAAEEGTLGTYFTNAADTGATGVVTWDHESEDGAERFVFGDVYEDGKKVGNLYDQFDRDTANLMMSDWLFDGTSKAKIFAESDAIVDPTKEGPKLTVLDEAVETKRQENNTEIPKALSAANFQETVKERQQEFLEGDTDLAIAAGGAAGGAAVGAGTGAAIGSFFFGVGAAPGAAVGGGIGGLVGGVGAWLNRDALSEQAARAYEITSIANREEGTAAGIFTGVAEFGGFGAKLISPTSNLYQGIVDTSIDKAGDGESEFYAVNKDGTRKVGNWVKAGDVAASVGDAALQFASPIGVALYTTQMGTMIAGEVGAIATTGGKTFDYRSGQFDNVFTDDDGNLDLLSGAAGIGKIGIDVVQLGMGRGLVGKANAERAAITGKSPYSGVFGRESAAQGNKVTVGGYRYTLDDAGQAVSRRATLAMLAPSEQLAAVSTSALARRATAKSGGAASADDFYRAAVSMSHGEKKVRTTIVNAMGEGYEEGVQSVLEPLSHNADLDAREIGSAALYGFASGAGMGVGVAARGVTADQRMFSTAKLAREMMTDGAETISWDEWTALPEVEKRTAAAMSGLMRETALAASQQIVEDQAIETVGGTPAVHKLNDAVQSWLQQQLAKANPRTDGAFVITQLEDAGEVDADGNLKPGVLPSDAVATSAMQLVANMQNVQRGFEVQLAKKQGELDTFDQTVDAAIDPAEVAVQKAALERQVNMIVLTMEMGQRLMAELAPMVQDMSDPAATYAEIEADAEEINVLLRNAFHRRFDSFAGEALNDDAKFALARSASVLFARDPHDSSGSYQVLVPQVSARLAAANADNVLEVSHAVLPATRGDYDGDKFRQLNQVVLDETEFTNARSGAHFVGAGSSVNVKAPKYEKYIVEYLSEALGSTSPTMASYATGTLTTIGDTIRRRYQGAIDQAALDRVLENFFDAVRANSKDARSVLLDGLATEAGGEINAFARENLSNEWLWIDQVIKSNFNTFQGVYAEQRDVIQEPNTEKPAPVRQESTVWTRAMVRAATAGQTLGLLTAGDSMFRKFQKLHYTSIGAPVRSADGKREAPMALVEMAMLYEALGAGVSRSALDEIRAKDEITGRVFIQLQALAADAQNAKAANGERLSSQQALAVVANMAVLDFDQDQDGNYVPGKVISMTQLLLKRELAADRKRNDAIFDLSPELQAKHRRLAAMTRVGKDGLEAERAFAEVVGSQQFYTLLGDQAEIFGPHLTVEQFIRTYVSMSEADRRELDHKLKTTQPEYLGRKSKKDMPYHFDEVENDEITAYRAVVDSIIAVGHNRITIDKDGTLHGELAEKSDRTSKDFQKAHAAMRSALKEMLGRKGGNVDQVRRLLESNPDFAKRLMALIPNSSAAAVLEERGGEVYIANWVYGILTEDNAAKAEMHYWRNLLLAEYNAINAKSLVQAEIFDEDAQVTYSKLPRRMHRVLVNLGRLNDQGRLLKQFINEMETATSLSEFLKWVNTTPGVRGNQAPLTAWVDDTAEFDADKAQGGWTTSLQGAELREAIGMLRKSAVNLSKDMREERMTWAKDTVVLNQIEEVIKAEAGDSLARPTEEGRIAYAQFEKALQLAEELNIGLGPQAMIYEIVGAARGFYPQAHTKGKNPDYVELFGQFDAQRDAFGFVTNYDRVMAALNTLNMRDVANNPSLLAKDDVRTMDDYGREVQWSKPDVAGMIRLLKDPETRPLARSILFPQVMERTTEGGLSTQLLVGKSVAQLLDGTSLNQIFPTMTGRLSQDAALRYASLVDGTARKRDAHHALVRAANDLVIARTSGATRVLSSFDLEKMATDALQDIVRVLQSAAALSTKGDPTQEDLLTPILDRVRDSQRVVRAANALGLERNELTMLDELLDEFTQQAEEEAKREKVEILKRPTASPAEDEALAEQAERVDEDLERTKQKIEALRSNNSMLMAQEMFLSDDWDDAASAPKKQKLTEYVLANLHIEGSDAAVKAEIRKLTNHVLDTSNATLPSLNWDVLGRAAVSHYIDDFMGVASAGASSPLFPDADHPQDQRYFDSSFTYLIEPLLEKGSPLLEAAKELHLLAGRHMSTPDVDLYTLISRTVLDSDKLGTWTADIPRASIEANQRLDSAAAAAELSKFGESPKDQAAVSAATRRTYRIPTDDMLSTVVVTLDDIDPKTDALERQVDVMLPGATVPQKNSLAMLNNRFAKSVTITYTDAAGVEQVMDLLAADPNVGRPFLANQAAAASGYVAVHNGRIYRSLDRLVDGYPGFEGVDRDSIRIGIEFFHPDSQPPATVENNEWTNNLFFEGVSFSLDADNHESLNSTLWFAPGAISPAGQANALDASKLGQPALKVIETPSAAAREAIEAEWKTSLAEVLRAKTSLVLATDLGFGNLDIEYFNAIYKNMKIRHYARVNGELWSAEQVIAFQQANPEDTETLANATLWVPSDPVLRSLLGEQGTKGVDRLFDDQLEIDPSRIQTYVGIRPSWTERFAGSLETQPQTLEKTAVANRARQAQLTVRAQMDDVTRSKHEIRLSYLTSLESDIKTARARERQGGTGRFDISRNLKSAVTAAGNMLSSENVALNWTRGGVPWIGARKPSGLITDRVLLRELQAAMNDDGWHTGWVYRENGPGNLPGGELTQDVMNDKQPKAFSVSPGDLVVVQLDSFEGDQDTAKKRLTYLAGRGANIALGTDNGTGDITAEMALYMHELNYEPVIGSKHLYSPIEMSSRYQNPRARLSDLVETRGVSPRRRVVVFNTQGLEIEEGAGLVDFDNSRLSDVRVSLDLVPVDFMAGFNVPANQQQIDQTRAHLLGLDNKAGRDLLRNQAHGTLKGKERKEADQEFDRAWRLLVDRIKRNEDSVLPQPGDEFGTGDFIPLVDLRGRVLLYRHGFKAPANRERVDEMLAEDDGRNVAIFPSKRETLATTHRGRVVEFKPRAGYGLSVELDINLQLFGEKFQLDWNGMKYVLKARPKEIQLPAHGFLSQDRGIDIISDFDTLASKEAFDGLIDNHRNAFAYFGIDFLDDVVRFFYPNEPITAQRRQDVTNMLHAINRSLDTIPIAAAHEILSGGRIGSSVRELMPALEGGVGTAWMDSLGEGDVSSQIATAIIIYLMTPGARVDDVLRSGGFNDDENTDQTRQSRLMPRLFTQVFDRAPLGSDLRKEINRRLNSQIFNPNTDGTGYVLHENFRFEILNGRAGGNPNTRTYKVVDGAVVAYIGTEPVGRLTYGTASGEVGSVAVLPEFRRRGIATGMLEFARQQGIQINMPPERTAAGDAWAAANGVPVAPLNGFEDPAEDDGSNLRNDLRRVPKLKAPKTGNARKNMQGWLQFAEAHPSGDNPILNGMSFDDTARQAASGHSAAVLYQAIGGETPVELGLRQAQLQKEGAHITRFKADQVDGGAWEMITGPARRLAGASSQWRALTPAEVEYMSLSRDAMIQYRKPINTRDINMWSDRERKEYHDLRRRIVRVLGLKDVQAEVVDGWVRQRLGAPAGQDINGDDSRGRVSGRASLEAAADIFANVERGFLPTLGAMVPLLHLHDLQMIYRANQHRSRKWEPKESLDVTKVTTASSWDSWVTVSLGSALTNESMFDRLFLSPLDGMMHSYRNAVGSLMDLPVSMDAIASSKLLEPGTNKTVTDLDLFDQQNNRFRVSINPTTDLLTSQPIVLDTARASLQDLMGGQRVAGKYRHSLPPASEVQKRLDRQRRWRKENDIPLPVETTMKNFRKNGDSFRENSSNTNALSRALINLRVGTATINPALYISMGPEQWIRGTLDRASNLITGQGTVGVTATAMSKLGASVYSSEQLQKLHRLYDTLGERNDFKSMVYRSLMYLRPYEPGMGRIEKWLENYAKFGSRMQDPTYGMRAKTLARRYVEAAIQHIEARPTANILTIDQLIAELAQNPEFLKNYFPEAHEAATNAVAQIRSMKETVLSQTLKGIYEPMAESSNAAVNLFGNVVLKVPLLFSGYAMNVATTITGMQGASDFVAMMVDQRKKGPNGIFGRIQKTLRGDEITDQDDLNFDMSSVLEGIDLTRSFIRGGLTHTGLFTFGLMAGGLGLSGEDDEAKKRRRMSELQGAGFVYDPRELENDFRNKDMIWLPFLGGDDGMVQLNWTLKQFISPIIGFEKFYETGDFAHVTWGFQEALNSFPLINTLMWDDAVQTAHALAEQADKQSRMGDEKGLAAAAGLLGNAVGVYERMLFENAFVNQLYTSLDRWDRDPYALPLLDSDGTIQRDIEGNARKNDLATTPYLDPETGTIKTGYMGRDTGSGERHALAENRATFAFVSAIFTGGTGSDYLRWNMPIKERELEKTPTSEADAETFISGAYLGSGTALPSLTNTEAISIARKFLSETGGDYWDDALINELAGNMIAEQNKYGPGGMSVLDQTDREHLTTEGAMAIYSGLVKGSLHFGDPALQGLHVTFEQREAIQEKWTKALIQEGMDLGLDETKATSRMKRLWNGEYGTDQIGIGEILWADKEKLSYSDTMTYQQLNTTYVIGPDGFPWATGASRGGIISALGLSPFKQMLGAGSDAMGLDSRLNSTDLVNQVNTGLRGLVLKDDSVNVPTDKEIADSIIKAIEDAAAQTYTPYTPYSSNSGGGGYGGYGGGFGYGGYGGGGGGYYGPRVYFEPMRDFADIRTPYSNSIPMINTSNPLIRRGDVRRERVWSERGRLKQWQ